jgi:pyruvyl transferase EpsO
MSYLKQRLSIISEQITHRNIIYLDYPIHLNVGDLLIYKGATSFFDENGYNVVLAQSVYNFNVEEINKILEATKCSIVLHGGGNFGDLYSIHQDLRRRVFECFPEQNIVMLPQSAHYNREELIEKDKKIICNLKNTHFFARDKASSAIFNSLEISNSLAPDMAHQLFGLIDRGHGSGGGTLRLLRKDAEISQFQKRLKIDSGIREIDWSDLLTANDKAIARFVKIPQKLSVGSTLSYLAWSKYADVLKNKMARYFSRYDKIYTSRLHAHILASLLSIDSEVVDNSYGKNFSYLDSWTASIEGVSMVS